MDTIIEQMRWQVMHAYRPRCDKYGRIISWDWAADVAVMSDAQVHSTYMRLMNAGKIKGI